MNIEKLLEYQKKDFEIIKLERKINDSESKKVLNDMIAKVKESQNKSMQLEKVAGDLLAEYNKLVKTFEENSSKLETISKQKLENSSLAEIETYEHLTNSIANNLAILEKKFIFIAENINNILNQFESAKKSYNLARQNHKVHKEKYDKQMSEITPIINKIESELKEIEKQIEPDLLSKYKQKRQDKMFPIFVPEMENTCGGCRMSLSYVAMGNLKEKGFIECENCRRIIYKNK